jgi:hypothetical protein
MPQVTQAPPRRLPLPFLRRPMLRAGIVAAKLLDRLG